MQQRWTRRRVVLSVSVLLSIILLAIGLNSFELASGLRIRSTETAERLEQALQEGRENDRIWLSGEVLGRIASVVTALAIVFFFVAQRRRDGRIVSAILVFILGLMVLLFAILPQRDTRENPGFTEGDPDIIGQGAIGAVEEMDPEDAVDVSVSRPMSQDPVVWIVTAAAAVGLIVVLRPSLSIGRRGRPADESVESAVARQAEQAAREADGSGAVLSVVIRCYRDMLAVYRSTRFTGKPQSLTPREFAVKLTEAGVHPAHAWDLTGLFERARYGDMELSSEEEAHAIACLRGISEALQR